MGRKRIPECLIYLAEVLHGPAGDMEAKVRQLDPTIKNDLLQVNDLARKMGAEITSRQIVALFVYFWIRNDTIFKYLEKEKVCDRK